MSAPASDEIREAADLVAIERTVARYARAVDAKRWQDLEAVFAAGAVVDFTANGGVAEAYPAVVGYLREAMSIFAASQHYMMNFDIAVTGDRAAGRFYCLTQMVTIDEGADRLLSDGGFYDARFVRTPDGWRISFLRGGLVWLDGEWPAGVPRPDWYGVSADRF